MMILQHRKAQNMKFGKQEPRTRNQFTCFQDGLDHVNSYAMLYCATREKQQIALESRGTR